MTGAEIKMRGIENGVALSGSMAGFLASRNDMTWQSWTALCAIIGVGLFFGTIARIGMIESDPNTTPDALRREKRLSIMLFGALYIIAFGLTEMINASILTAPLIGAAVGSAGPIAIHWLVERFFGELKS